ncbi:MAG: alpha-ribazole phosphatase [Arenicella sp.]
MLIHFVRHTTPEIQANICYGQKDIELAHSFEEESSLILRTLELQSNKAQYDKIFSSPAKRCMQLAKKIEQKQPSKHIIKTINALQEVNFGDWEGKHWDTICRTESQAWTDDFINTAPPNGESLIEMKQRVDAFLQQLLASNASNIIVVTHAGVLRLVAAYFLKIPLENIFNLKLSYGAIFSVQLINKSYSLQFIS